MVVGGDWADAVKAFPCFSPYFFLQDQVYYMNIIRRQKALVFKNIGL